MTSILKVDTIQDADGNNIINESGNTITIGASGDTTNIIGTLQNDGAAVGGVNTPAFEAYPSGTQTISADSWTKLNFATERFDTDGKYDASTSKFTPTVSGKYYIYATLSITGSADAIESIQTMIYKNGSSVINTLNIFGTHDHSEMSQFVYGIDIADADDYYEIYGNVNVSSGNAAVSSARSFFGAYKIIE